MSLKKRLIICCNTKGCTNRFRSKIGEDYYDFLERAEKAGWNCKHYQLDFCDECIAERKKKNEISQPQKRHGI